MRWLRGRNRAFCSLDLHVYRLTTSYADYTLELECDLSSRSCPLTFEGNKNSSTHACIIYYLVERPGCWQLYAILALGNFHYFELWRPIIMRAIVTKCTRYQRNNCPCFEKIDIFLFDSIPSIFLDKL